MSGYEQVLAEVERLSPEDQLRLMERVAASLRRRIPAGKTRSVGIEGARKGIGRYRVQKYIDEGSAICGMAC